MKHDISKAMVIGFGESGQAAAELLLQKGVHVIVHDDFLSHRIEEFDRDWRMRWGTDRIEASLPSRALCRVDLGVLSPGIRPDVSIVKQLRENQTPVVGELELAFRYCQCPVVAVTGTNGKSTTTELVYHVLSVGGFQTSACGNLGNAFSRTAARSRELDYAVVEVSSFQLETIETFRPQVTVYLNFAPDHLDRYATLQEYWSAKVRIFENQTPEDTAIVNASCRYPEIRAKKVTFSAFGAEADYTFENGWLCHRGKRLLAQEKTHLRGVHNAENQLAALAVGDLYGVAREKIFEALCAYKALPHRCELVRELDGVTYINDSKATNVDALEKALISQTAPVVLIAGGKDKGFDFAPLAKLVKEKVRHAVLMGEARERLFSVLSTQTDCRRAENMEDAVSQARALAKTGDVVLLSPGCSSFDAYTNFEERGDAFKACVNQIK